MSDDFNIDDYMDDPDFENKMEEYRTQTINEAIDINFDNIKKKGISEWHLRHMPKQELKELKATLIYMTKHYIDFEDYERCAVLKTELEKLESILERVS
jgi:hypothetical protein|tara:strand:+ start:52 stop:348 length:297 start_codon:yes stop_codon:yes gene_type:complete